MSNDATRTSTRTRSRKRKLEDAEEEGSSSSAVITVADKEFIPKSKAKERNERTGDERSHVWEVGGASASADGELVGDQLEKTNLCAHQPESTHPFEHAPP